jgi:hypothetical protein
MYGIDRFPCERGSRRCAARFASGQRPSRREGPYPCRAIRVYNSAARHDPCSSAPHEPARTVGIGTPDLQLLAARAPHEALLLLRFRGTTIKVLAVASVNDMIFLCDQSYTVAIHRRFLHEKAVTHVRFLCSERRPCRVLG